MLKNNDSVSFLATLDADASRIFYEECLGLNFVADEYFALVFNLNGHTLRVAKVGELSPAAHTVFGWIVNNIEETAKELANRGVNFEMNYEMQQDQLGIWVSPSGAKVAWFKDPDGNNLSITQLENDNVA